MQTIANLAVGGVGLLAYLIFYLILGLNLPERKIIMELAYSVYRAGRARIRL